MVKFKMSENAKECRKHWYDKYREIKGVPYNASFAKDGRLFGLLADRYPGFWVKGMIDFFLQWEDEFIMKAGYTVPIFFHMINKMLELNIQKSRWAKKYEKKTGLSKEYRQDLIDCLSGKK